MELLILNKKFETIYIIDTFESLIWTDRYSSYGDFELYTSANSTIFNYVQPDYYLWGEHSDHLMILENRKIETDIELGNHFTITGKSLESLLRRRIVWPQMTLEGNLEEQIEKLLNNNVINPSNIKRKISNFIFERSNDPYIESLKVKAQFTGDEVYEAIKKLCEEANIGFKITLNDQNKFVFKLYSGVDRSYDQDINPYVVFSPGFENIINSNYYESKQNFKNVAIVAGEGEGSARRSVIVGDENLSELSRREIFTDARDISSSDPSGTLTNAQYDDLLRQRGLENLSDNRLVQSFEGQVEATQMYQYGKDFFMGDITQLENEYGMKSKVRVIEFIHSENKNGIENYPTFEVLD